MDCSQTTDTRKHFCVGFLFSQSGCFVALVHKKRPAWQAGKMNGIGGGVEEGETAIEAQRREFKEETSFDFKDWERVGVMRCDTCDVDIFRGFIEADDIDDLPELIPEEREDGSEPEEPEWIEVSEIGEYLHSYRFLHNVGWLVHFCLDTRGLSQDAEFNYRRS